MGQAPVPWAPVARGGTPGAAELEGGAERAYTAARAAPGPRVLIVVAVGGGGPAQSPRRRRTRLDPRPPAAAVRGSRSRRSSLPSRRAPRSLRGPQRAAGGRR